MAWRARWWLLIPIGVLALLLLAATALIFLVDPNRFRSRLETEINARTGWTVTVGALHWQLWPRLAVTLGEGGIGGEGLPLRWRSVAVSAQWRPLLHGQIALDRVAIEGLSAALAVDGEGRGNWQSLLDRLQAARAGQTPGAQRPLQLSALLLHDADVDFTDARSKFHAHAAHANLSLGLATDPNAVRLADLTLDAQVSGGPLTGSVLAAFAAPTLTWAAPVLTLPTWTLRAGNVTLEGRETVPVRFAPMEAGGQLHAQCSSLRELLATLGMPPRPMRDRAVLGATEVDAGWSWHGGALDLTALSVTADGTHLTGEAHWTTQPQPRLTVQATGGAVDLDRYLPPTDTKSAPLELPATLLKSLPIAGTLSFQSARLHGVVLQGVRLRLVPEASP